MPKTVLFVTGLPGTNLHLEEAGGGLGQQVFPPGLFALFQPLSPTLRARLSGPEDLTVRDGVAAGEPIRSTGFLGFDLLKQADSLYEILEECGVSGDRLRPVGWDWRRPVTDEVFADSAQNRFRAALEAAPQGVIVVVHSTGGLIVRHFLERHPDLAGKIGRLVCFGVPWAGTLKTFAMLTGQHGFALIGPADAQRVVAANWAAFDLLPRPNGPGLVFDDAGQPFDPLRDTRWAAPDLAAQIERRAAFSIDPANYGAPGRDWTAEVPVTNLAGWGEKTLVRADVGNAGNVVFNPLDHDNEFGGGNVADERELVYQGDATVPLASAAWPRGDGFETLFIPIGATHRLPGNSRPHNVLWRNTGGREVLKHLLSDDDDDRLDAFAYAAIDWSDKVDPGTGQVRVRFVLQRLDGTPLPGGVLRLRRPGPDVEVRPGPDGRGVARVERGFFPLTQGGRFRRAEMELDWDDAPQPKPQNVFIEP